MKPLPEQKTFATIYFAPFFAVPVHDTLHLIFKENQKRPENIPAVSGSRVIFYVFLDHLRRTFRIPSWAPRPVPGFSGCKTYGQEEDPILFFAAAGRSPGVWRQPEYAVSSFLDLQSSLQDVKRWRCEDLRSGFRTDWRPARPHGSVSLGPGNFSAASVFFSTFFSAGRRQSFSIPSPALEAASPWSSSEGRQQPGQGNF
jgi:hypothetical protein